MRAWTALFLVCWLAACATAQSSVVGTWILDPKGLPADGAGVGLTMTFRKDRTMTLKSARVEGQGTYQVVGNEIRVRLKLRREEVPDPRESKGTCRLAEGGKVLLADSGIRRNGKPVMMRLVRKR